MEKSTSNILNKTRLRSRKSLGTKKKTEKFFTKTQKNVKMASGEKTLLYAFSALICHLFKVR